MIAVAPWQGGHAPPPGADLEALALVYYPWVEACTNNHFDRCYFPGYRTDDEWGGGAWVEADGQSAVLVFGRKGLGENCYGTPGVTCPSSLCSIDQGYHSDPYEPRVLFYDPEEVLEVAAGDRQPWEVLPYDSYRPMDEVFEPDCGRLGAAAWDRQRRLLYVTEKLAGSSGETVVHVWSVGTDRAAGGARLRGRVRDAATGLPIADATVKARCRGGGTRRATTDHGGRYAFGGLSACVYRVKARARGYRSETVTQEVSDSGSVRLDFDLEPR
jgi:hypothetical protein